jgi:hypothetical protein
MNGLTNATRLSECVTLLRRKNKRRKRKRGKDWALLRSSRCTTVPPLTSIDLGYLLI